LRLSALNYAIHPRSPKEAQGTIAGPLTSADLLSLGRLLLVEAFRFDDGRLGEGVQL